MSEVVWIHGPFGSDGDWLPTTVHDTKEDADRMQASMEANYDPLVWPHGYRGESRLFVATTFDYAPAKPDEKSSAVAGDNPADDDEQETVADLLCRAARDLANVRTILNGIVQRVDDDFADVIAGFESRIHDVENHLILTAEPARKHLD